MKRLMAAGLACLALVFPAFAGGKSENGSAQKLTTLTLLMDTDSSRTGLDAVCALAEKELGIKVDIEIRQGGSEGDNIVKTRLASGEMTDLCWYNSGSLLQALNPSKYFIDISKEKWASRLDDTFVSAVSKDGAIYGIPVGSCSVGAILYNKKLYAKYHLTPPKTWQQFMANCKVLQDAGEIALIGTFKDSWTSQVMFLGDNYNVCALAPEFPARFEQGTAKYLTTPAALRSFGKLAETTPYYNKDYLAASFSDGLEMLATGKGAHWAMLSFALTSIATTYGDAINDIGVFAIPGDDPKDNGITVWAPAGLYGNKNSKKHDAILKFMEFYISDEALNAYAAAALPDGPYAIKGYKLPPNAYPAVAQDMQAYFDAGKTDTALEFKTAVKGANAPSICQECASGQTTAKEAAAIYDSDCYKQAVQLGLNWKE